MFRFVLTRDPKSYDFKADRKKPDGFTNNWKNNSLDELALYHDDTLVFRARCQSVANYCFGAMAPGDTTSFGDTVAPGKFTVRCFVPPRAFHGEIHAIVNTRDIDGQIINHDASSFPAAVSKTGAGLSMTGIRRSSDAIRITHGRRGVLFSRRRIWRGLPVLCVVSA